MVQQESQAGITPLLHAGAHPHGRGEGTRLRSAGGKTAENPVSWLETCSAVPLASRGVVPPYSVLAP